MKMTVRTYASFEVLVELDTEDADEAEREALEWIGENAGELTGSNVEVIQLPAPSRVEDRVLKTGDRVTAPLDGEREPGTVVSLFFLGRNGPEAWDPSTAEPARRSSRCSERSKKVTRPRGST